jgi:hypothetical protein
MQQPLMAQQAPAGQGYAPQQQQGPYVPLGGPPHQQQGPVPPQQGYAPQPQYYPQQQQQYAPQPGATVIYQQSSQMQEPPGFLFKCCCPCCAVMSHEGCEQPACILSWCLGCWFTVFCWQPKMMPVTRMAIQRMER